MLHVYPLNDEKEHDLDGTQCWCGPRVMWKDPDTGEALSEAIVVHRSADFREVIEEAEKLVREA